jgi:hypothetical protein
MPGAVRKVFSPQHGFSGDKQDNMAESGHGLTPEDGPSAACTPKPSSRRRRCSLASGPWWSTWPKPGPVSAPSPGPSRWPWNPAPRRAWRS